MDTYDTKYQLGLYTLFDYQSVEKHLEKMIAQGWKLEKTGAFLWKYAKVSPKQKKYAVVFLKNMSDYEPNQAQSQLDLQEICEESGWIKECEWRKMQIFSCDDIKRPLETDEAVKLESIRRAMKNSYVPSWIIVLCTMIFMVVWNMLRLHSQVGEGALANITEEAGVLWAVIFPSYAAFVAAIALMSYILWIKLSERSISMGGGCVSASWNTRLQVIMYAGAFILLAFYATDMRNSTIISAIGYAVLFLFWGIAVVGLTALCASFLKEKGISKKINLICSGTLCVLLGVLMAGIM